jgi:peptide/nickel transport system ATP-binding protein
VEHIATQVAVMYLGRVVELAPTAELFKNPRHPYTQALLGSVLTPEPGLGLPDLGLGLSFPDPLHPPSGCTFHPRCPRATAACPVRSPELLRNGLGEVACHLYDSEDLKVSS